MTSLFVLMSVVALEKLARFGREGARLLFFLCVAHFAFWYTAHIFDERGFAQALLQYETGMA